MIRRKKKYKNCSDPSEIKTFVYKTAERIDHLLRKELVKFDPKDRFLLKARIVNLVFSNLYYLVIEFAADQLMEAEIRRDKK